MLTLANYAGPERRCAVRHLCHATEWTVAVEVSDQEERWSAIVRDVSVSGMGLAVGKLCDPGTLLEVEIEGVIRVPSLSLRVVRMRQQAGTSWLLGCLLAEQLSADELEALLANYASRVRLDKQYPKWDTTRNPVPLEVR
jgi:hypothetical protein